MGNDEKTKCDVVIAGAGGAGLMAALALSESDLRVKVYEKMNVAGGSTRFPEGMFGAESTLQKKRNVRVTRDEAFKAIMDYSHWKANASLVRAFVDKSAATIDWLEQMGVEFTEPSSFWPGAPRTWHLFKGRGAAVIKVLLSRAVEKGVAIQYQTAVKQLRRQDDGPVTGVLVEDQEGRQTAVSARAVIIATGGYANDPELIKKYTGLDLRGNLFPLGNFEKYGEGLRMAWAVGAAKEGLGVLNFSSGGPVGPGLKPAGHIVAAVRQPELWINQQGLRFCDEAIVHNSIYCGNAMARQKGGFVFRIFDDQARHYFVEKGVDVGVGMFVPPGTRLTGFDDELKEALAKKNRNIMVAGTIEDLALKMEVTPAVFKKTVEVYNRFCEKGYDEAFAKDRLYLRPVQRPPFYAFKCFGDFCGTNGGIKINEKTEVLDHADQVIPGLYAVGNDAGGLYGDSYDMIAAGAACGFALVSGWLAGENVIGYFLN
ncbi:MAG: FAD-dependent oxidoreductase [Deltaproteobacteria bacterium]|nr:FAD-dependent oxidoreductase [Deltaproteobacteria bacterium]